MTATNSMNEYAKLASLNIDKQFKEALENAIKKGNLSGGFNLTKNALLNAKLVLDEQGEDTRAKVILKKLFDLLRKDFPDYLKCPCGKEITINTLSLTEQQSDDYLRMTLNCHDRLTNIQISGNNLKDAPSPYDVLRVALRGIQRVAQEDLERKEMLDKINEEGWLTKSTWRRKNR